jgi:hypothetical protein
MSPRRLTTKQRFACAIGAVVALAVLSWLAFAPSSGAGGAGTASADSRPISTNSADVASEPSAARETVETPATPRPGPADEGQAAPAAPTYLIGRTVDERGGVLPGVRLRVLGANARSLQETRSDAAGRFEFAGARRQVAQLHAEHPGRASAWTDLVGAVAAEDSGAEPFELEVVLRPGFDLAARVEWSDGEPCADAGVEARGADGRRCGPLEAARADAAGNFQLVGLDAERTATLAISPPQLRDWHRTAIDPLAARDGLVIVVPRAGVLHVKFAPAAPREVSARVLVRRTDGQQELSLAYADQIDFQPLRVGSAYDLLVAPRGHAVQRRLESVVLESREQWVELEWLEPAGAAARERGAAWTVAWRVVDSQGQLVTLDQLRRAGLSGADLRGSWSTSEHSGDGPLITGLARTTPLRGEFALYGPPPGRVELEVAGESHVFEGLEPKSQVEATLDVEERAHERCEVRFRGKNEDGTPALVIGAKLEMRSGERAPSAAVDPRTTLTSAFLVVGDYSYVARDNTGREAVGEFRVAEVSEALDVTVVFPTLTSLRGRVVGLPNGVHGTVRALAATAGPASASAASTAVDSSGAFLLERVAPGPTQLLFVYRLADDSRLRLQQHAVDVIAGAAQELEVPYSPGAASCALELEFAGADRAVIRITHSGAVLLHETLDSGATILLPPGAHELLATPILADDASVRARPERAVRRDVELSEGAAAPLSLRLDFDTR